MSRSLRVSYGKLRVPKLGEQTHGGLVKFQHLSKIFPNHPYSFNLCYMVSSHIPPFADDILRFVTSRKIPLIWNQNGVNYEGSDPVHWRAANEQMQKFYRTASYIFFQSEFCKMAADKFLGAPPAQNEVLLNAVDLDFYCFSPKQTSKGPLRLLAAGTLNKLYRFETAIRVLSLVQDAGISAELVIAGRLCWAPRAQMKADLARIFSTHPVRQSVSFIDAFSQNEAPSIFKSCDVLVHTKYNDPCPGIVIEAMASGLPVVYSSSGGLPEIVGINAGIGVKTELDWTRIIPPDAEQLAQAVVRVRDSLSDYSQEARLRAEKNHNFKDWVDRHRKVFAQYGDLPA